MAGNPEQVRVLIIGAGLGGISTAINLKQKLGFSNFIIYEKASAIGGTWRDNTYPGCGCDVPSHWYSLSSELNPQWSHYYALQPEILDYWKRLVVKHELYPHIVFNTRVVSETWDSTAQVWSVEVERNTPENGTKKREFITAELVVSASGGFAAPGYANLQGMDMFQGPMFHSSRWDYSVGLQGKHVGVIGNGCSAAQFIPKISEDPSVKVINFCRTPNWFAPWASYQHQYSSLAKWIFKYIPFTARMYRNIIACISDLGFLMWPKRNTWVRAVAERAMLRHMRKMTPAKYHEELTPKYPAGCKRIVRDAGYYKSLHRPNVELKWGEVKEIVKDGLITDDGKKHELDVIIYATGFLLVDPCMRTVGKNGQTLAQYFESRGGPEAYLGSTIPGFPNLFLILGPNVASGHGSAIFSEEQEIQYALQLMRPVIEGKAQSFDVRADVSHTFNDDLQRRLGETTWSSCRSFYRIGPDNLGKNIATFPGPVLQLWYWTRKVRWEDYVAEGGEKWDGERKRKKLVRRVVVSLLSTIAVYAAKSWSRISNYHVIEGAFTRLYSIVN
ncbi:FAD/NAD-binding domain-containing protein [Ramaria rubella]|nr:FAD/NAD-binding domain-containing protein [Ramaria rubella]